MKTGPAFSADPVKGSKLWTLIQFKQNILHRTEIQSPRARQTAGHSQLAIPVIQVLVRRLALAARPLLSQALSVERVPPQFLSCFATYLYYFVLRI